jgi:hypothetical protein
MVGAKKKCIKNKKNHDLTKTMACASLAGKRVQQSAFGVMGAVKEGNDEAETYNRFCQLHSSPEVFDADEWYTLSASDDGQHVCIAGRSGVYVSSAYGDHWKLYRHPRSVVEMAVGPSGRYVYLMDKGLELHRSDDYGVTFDVMNKIDVRVSAERECLSDTKGEDMADPSFVYVAGGGGDTFQSTVDPTLGIGSRRGALSEERLRPTGDDWQLVETVYKEEPVAIAAGTNGTVYALTSVGGLWKHSEGWVRLEPPPMTGSRLQLYTRGERVALYNSVSIVHSHDGGANWTDPIQFKLPFKDSGGRTRPVSINNGGVVLVLQWDQYYASKSGLRPPTASAPLMSVFIGDSTWVITDESRTWISYDAGTNWSAAGTGDVRFADVSEDGDRLLSLGAGPGALVVIEAGRETDEDKKSNEPLVVVRSEQCSDGDHKAPACLQASIQTGDTSIAHELDLETDCGSTCGFGDDAICDEKSNTMVMIYVAAAAAMAAVAIATNAHKLRLA